MHGIDKQVDRLLTDFISCVYDEVTNVLLDNLGLAILLTHVQHCLKLRLLLHEF